MYSRKRGKERERERSVYGRVGGGGGRKRGIERERDGSARKTEKERKGKENDQGTQRALVLLTGR